MHSVTKYERNKGFQPFQSVIQLSGITNQKGQYLTT